MTQAFAKHIIIFLILGIGAKGMSQNFFLPIKENGNWKMFEPKTSIISAPLPFDSVGVQIENKYHIVEKKGKFGIVDFSLNDSSIISFEEYIPATFDTILTYNAYTLGKKGKKWFFIFTDSKKIHPVGFDAIDVFQNIAITSENDKKGWWKSGLEIRKPEFKYVILQKEYLIAGNNYGELGLFNQNGELLIPLDYDYFNLYNGNDNYLVTSHKEGKSTLFHLKRTINGNQFKKLKYSEGYPSFIVSSDQYRVHKENQTLLVNLPKDSVIHSEYDHVFNAEYFDFLVVSNGQKVGVLNGKSNNPVVGLNYDHVTVADSLRFIARKGGYYGVINDKEQVIVPFQYQRIISYLSGGKSMFMLVNNKKVGLANWTGEVIVPVELEKMSYVNGMFFCKKEDSLVVYGAGGKRLIKTRADRYISVEKAAVILLDENNNTTVLLRDSLIHQGYFNEINFEDQYLKITQNTTVYYYYLTPEYTLDESFVYKNIRQVEVDLKQYSDTNDIEYNIGAGASVMFLADQTKGLIGAYSFPKKEWVLTPQYFTITPHNNDFYTGLRPGDRSTQNEYGNFASNVITDIIYNFTTIDRNIVNFNFKSSDYRTREVGVRDEVYHYNALYKNKYDRYKFTLNQKNIGRNGQDFVYPTYTENHDLIVNSPQLNISPNGKRTLAAIYQDNNDLGIQYPADKTTLDLLNNPKNRLEITGGDVNTSKIFEYGSGVRFVKNKAKRIWKENFDVLPDGNPASYPYKTWLNKEKNHLIHEEYFVSDNYTIAEDNSIKSGIKVSKHLKRKYQIYNKNENTFSGTFDVVELLGDGNFLVKNKNDGYRGFDCGILYPNGDTLIQLDYQSIESTPKGYIAESKFRFGVLAKNGKTIIPFEYNNIEWRNNQFYCNISSRNYTILEADGDTILPLRMRLMNSTEQGTILAKKGQEYLVFNSENKLLFRGNKQLDWIINDSIAAVEEWWGVKLVHLKSESVVHRFINCTIDKVRFPITGISIQRQDRVDFYIDDFNSPEKSFRKGFDEHGFAVEQEGCEMYLTHYSRPEMQIEILRPTYSFSNNHILFNIINGATIAMDIRTFERIPIKANQNIVCTKEGKTLVYDNKTNRYLIYEENQAIDSTALVFDHNTNQYWIFTDSVSNTYSYNLKSMSFEYLESSDQLALNNSLLLLKYEHESFFISSNIIQPYFAGRIISAGHGYYQLRNHLGGIGYIHKYRVDSSPSNSDYFWMNTKLIRLPTL